MDELKVGDTAQISKIITEEVVNGFAKATGDSNPIHLNQVLLVETY